MKIFKQEIADGLESKIKASASFTYACEVDRASTINKKEIKAIAGVEDKDLYYTQSILVTTDWNRNDDIFDPYEVWMAKDTPEHKPTNIEHEESKIVGHIVGNWPITEEGIIIDRDTPVNNLPKKFHVLTASVIYTGFTEPELKDRTAKLIGEIEEGTKYVSMECFFNGFDYGLYDNATGELKVIPRTEDTAYLTKHLRSYGGLGEYQQHKIGRLLRNITFSGKGFVDRPANPESIIFQKEDFKFFDEQKNNKNSEKGVFSIQANIQEANMSSNLNTNDKVEAMKECEELTKEAYAARDAIKAQASELEIALAEKDMEMKKKEKEMMEKEEAMKKYGEDMKKKNEDMEKEMAELSKKDKENVEKLYQVQAELDAVNEVLAGYKVAEEEMMKKEKKMKRMASLIEAGLNSEAATAEVDKFETLEDESFANMVSLITAMKNEGKKEDMKMEKDDKAMMPKKKASEDLSSALENVEVANEPVLTVASDSVEDEMNTTRAALIDFVYNRLGKTLDKGE